MRPLLPRHPVQKQLSSARHDEEQALLDGNNRACDGPPDPEEEARRRAMRNKQRLMEGEASGLVWKGGVLVLDGEPEGDLKDAVERDREERIARAAGLGE